MVPNGFDSLLLRPGRPAFKAHGRRRPAGSDLRDVVRVDRDGVLSP